MATAEELLSAALGEDGVDNTLTIDLISRVINIPKSIQHIGVESDDEVLTLKFSMPRYYYDVDLSMFTKYINYVNAKGGEDVYKITNETFDNTTITFSWLVSRFALTFEGNVKFNVCMKKYQDNNPDMIVLEEFNTTIATLPVLKGLETGEAVAVEYADILAQWESKLFGIGDTTEQRISDIADNYLARITNEVDTIIRAYCTEKGINVPSDDYIKMIVKTYIDSNSTQIEILTNEEVASLISALK